jgi:hypothetical protein
MKHAKLSASSSSRWLSCPASIKMSENIPQKPSSIYANEGSIAHELAEVCLKDSSLSPHDYVGDIQKLDNGFEMEITTEMASYVNEYVNYVWKLSDIGSPILKIEQRVNFNYWVPGGFGTSDAIIIDKNAGVIHIVDLKYGKGEKVFAEGNTQAQLYALGIFQEYGDINFRKIVIHIHQPRLDHVDQWEVPVNELTKFGLYVKEQAKLCLTDDAPFNPSDKACRWCPAASKCKALTQHTLEAVSKEFDDLDGDLNLKDTTLLSNEEISNLLPKLPMIEKWCKTIAEGAIEELHQGNSVPGYKLVEGRSNRNWTKEGEKAIVNMLDEEAYVERKLLSPAQAEKVLKKEKLHLCEDWVFKKPGKMTLAKESDKRPALLNVKDQFDHLGE